MSRTRKSVETDCGAGNTVSSWYEEKILKLMVVTVAQLCGNKTFYPAVFPVYHLQAAIFDQTTEKGLAENSVITAGDK